MCRGGDLKHFYMQLSIQIWQILNNKWLNILPGTSILKLLKGLYPAAICRGLSWELMY